MDFSFSEEQLSVRDLARGILDKEVSHERLKAIEAGELWFDAPLWSTLAEAGLLGIAVPEEADGMGFGFQELCVLSEEIGRAVAPVPVLPTLVLAALPIARFGTDEQKTSLLKPMVAGEVLLTAALVDSGSSDLEKPATRARHEGNGWVIDGEKSFVPMAAQSRQILVPAATADGVAMFLIDPEADGVTLTESRLANGENIAWLKLDGVVAGEGDLLGGAVADGEAQLRWIYERALVAISAIQVGVSSRSLEITSGYVSERVQFGVPIGSFQAVQHRAANGYIDVQAMRWVMWRAAWTLSQDLPAGRAAMVAKFWAADGGSRLANSAQHLHGGIGVDRDYPIHRYFLWTKSLELMLGGVPHQLQDLGRDMAQSGPQVR
jgi:alkylation response protein AidB-like acyl-CoA dehydrogenase